MVSYEITILLGDLVKGTTLTEEAANDTIIALIASPLITGIGMAVVDGQLFIAVFVMLHALAIVELRAVIHGDILEGALGKLRQRFTDGFHGSLTGFTEDAQDYFIARQTFRED